MYQDKEKKPSAHHSIIKSKQQLTIYEPVFALVSDWYMCHDKNLWLGFSRWFSPRLDVLLVNVIKVAFMVYHLKVRVKFTPEKNFMALVFSNLNRCFFKSKCPVTKSLSVSQGLIVF